MATTSATTGWARRSCSTTASSACPCWSTTRPRRRMRRAGREDPRLVEAVDVVPTILDALGLDPASHVVEGRSLVPALRGTARATIGATAPSASWTGPSAGARRRLGYPTGQHMAWMVRTDRWKYVHWTGGLRPQLFDLQPGPGRVPRPRRRRHAGRRARRHAAPAAAVVHPAQVAHDDHLGRGRAAHRQPQEGRRLPRRVVGMAGRRGAARPRWLSPARGCRGCR